MRNRALLMVIPVAAIAAVGAVASSQPSAAAVAVPVEAIAPATYEIDVVHSELSFRIRHLVGRVAGTFTDWSGTLTLDPAALADGSVEVSVNTHSISTLNEQRDDHLRTPDFFAADSFPTMTFRSTRIETAGNALEVHGELTLRGTTRPVVLDAIYLGRMMADPWGQERVAFLATTEIDRQEFGVSFNQALEEMTMIGDRVTIEIAIEAVRQ